MNKFKIFTIVILVITLFLTLYPVVYADFGEGFDSSKVAYDDVLNTDTGVNKITKPINKIFNTIVRILQILSIAGIILTGLRYMLTTDTLKKADLKESTMYLIIGMVIVFCASTIINFIVNAANEVIG